MNKGIEDITNMINMILPSWKMRPERKVFSQILHCIRIILNRFQQPEDEILVSYVTSLFTKIPLDETIYLILDQIYKQHKLPHIASQAIFKRLLERITKGTVFSFNGKLYK